MSTLHMLWWDTADLPYPIYLQRQSQTESNSTLFTAVTLGKKFIMQQRRYLTAVVLKW